MQNKGPKWEGGTNEAMAAASGMYGILLVGQGSWQSFLQVESLASVMIREPCD